MKVKLHKLKRMGKLSLSRGNRRGQNVLDLRKGSFSAGCRKASGMSAIVKIVLQLCLFLYCADIILQNYFDDHLVADQLDSSK